MQLGEKTEKDHALQSTCGSTSGENYCVRRALWTGAAVLRWTIPIGQLGTIGGGQHNRHKRHNNRRRPAQAYCSRLRDTDSKTHKYKYIDTHTDIRQRQTQTHTRKNTHNKFSIFRLQFFMLHGRWHCPHRFNSNWVLGQSCHLSSSSMKTQQVLII